MPIKREDIWNPNLVIKHRVDHHDIEPEFISFHMIRQKVMFLYDVIVNIACPMNFDSYPFDEQNPCQLGKQNLRSQSVSKLHLYKRWLESTVFLADAKEWLLLRLL